MFLCLQWVLCVVR